MFSTNIVTLQGMNTVRVLLMGGKTLRITRAVGGSAVSSESGLPAMTALPVVNQTLSVVCLIQGNDGPELLIRIASAGLETAYALHQIGIYARMDDEEEFLFQILQDENGANIPAQSEAVGLTLDVRAGLAVEVGEATVTLDSAAYVTYEQLRHALTDVPTMPGSVAFSVTPLQWEQNPNSLQTGFGFRAVVSDARFSAEGVPLVLFAQESLPVANFCGVSSACQTRDGELYLYAKEVPENATLAGECHMLIPGAGASNAGAIGGNGTWGALFGLS